MVGVGLSRSVVCGGFAGTTTPGRGFRRLICGLSSDCCFGLDVDENGFGVVENDGWVVGVGVALGVVSTGCWGVRTDLAITLVGSMMNTLPLRIITLFGLIRPAGGSWDLVIVVGFVADLRIGRIAVGFGTLCS